jgi:L-threonylcarbamoyladenylate synthase
MDARLVDDAVDAIRAGKPIVIPTDTVYGLCTSPDRPAALARLKRRGEGQPIALLASNVENVVEQLPEIDERAESLLRALLPGPLTLVLPNPGLRYPELTGSRPDAIGVRVPSLMRGAREIVRRLGIVAATSANLHGEPDPRRLDDVPASIREAAVVVDGGELPGIPSTVVDLTGREPKILREGAVPVADVLARIRRHTEDALS